MKKGYKSALILLLVVLAVGMTITIPTAGQTQNQGQNPSGGVIATVSKVIGKCSITNVVSQSTRQAAAGVVLVSDDSVKTEKESEVTLVLSDNKTIVTVKQESEFRLSQLFDNKNNKKTLFSLLYGAINAIVAKLSGQEEFIIQTPTGVVSVRGTGFDVAVSDLAETYVSVNDGTVAVTGDVDTMLVNKDENAQLDQDSKIVSVKGQGDTQQWLLTRNAMLDTVGLKKLKYLGGKVSLFSSHLTRLDQLVNEIWNDPDFQALKNKKVSNIELTPAEKGQMAVFRMKIYKIAYEAYRTVQRLDGIAGIMLRIADKITLPDEASVKLKEMAATVRQQIAVLYRKINIIYTIANL